MRGRGRPAVVSLAVLAALAALSAACRGAQAGGARGEARAVGKPVEDVFLLTGELRFFDEQLYHTMRHISPITDTQMRLMLREVVIKYTDLCTAVEAMDERKRTGDVGVDDLDDGVEILIQKGVSQTLSGVREQRADRILAGRQTPHLPKIAVGQAAENRLRAAFSSRSRFSALQRWLAAQSARQSAVNQRLRIPAPDSLC